MKIELKDDFVEVVFEQSVEGHDEQVKQGEELKNYVENLYKGNPDKKYKIMLNLTKPDLLIDTSSFEAVKIYQKIVDMEQTERMAVLGKSSFADTITELVLPKLLSKKANWFTDREKALVWLKV